MVAIHEPGEGTANGDVGNGDAGRGIPELKLVGPDDLRANYDQERARATIGRMAGSISQEEGERIKALIYRAREDGTRPGNRPLSRS